MKVKILSSHIIRSDIHKSSIISALNNPINQELVKQLNKYVDWDEIKELQDKDDSKKDNKKDEINEINEDNVIEEAPSHTNDKSNKHVSKREDKPSHSLDKHDDIKHQENEIDEDKEDNSKNEDENNNVESSTNIAENIISSLQEKLNASQTCKGVSLVSCKGNEIWVRYNDNINLNDIMYDAIKCVTDISPLTFNRLARFDNSIVFVK